MLPWLVVLAVTLVATDARKDSLNMASNRRGPNKICNNVVTGDRINVHCTLPSGDLHLDVSGSNRILMIYCSKDTTLVCDELQKVKPFFDKYKDTGKWDNSFNVVHIETCHLTRESLACLLGVLGANGIDLAKLQGVAGNLEPVLHEGLEGVTKLDMYNVGKDLASVPYNVLSLLPNLESLAIKKTFLELTSETGYVLSKLSNVIIDQCEIKSIPKGAFKATPEIQTLRIKSNLIKNIDVDAFKGLTKLVDLDLSLNHLTHLPGGMFRHTPNITYLYLNSNKLLDLSIDLSDDLFTGLNKLERILIVSNKAVLKLSNKTFSNLPSLYDLKLVRCFIENVPAELFRNTTNLKHLSLEKNDIKYLPNNIFKGLKLISLNLRRNKISYLNSDVFSEQTSMTELILSYNYLKSLSGGLFSNMNSLKILDLEHNWIEFLNKSTFDGLSSLKELSLIENRIEHIDQATLESTMPLKILILDNKAVLKLSNKTFSNLPSLYDLKLVRCFIENVPAELFRNTTNLKHLSLEENDIKYLPNNIFKGLKLISLNLRRNKISYLNSDVFSEQTSMTELILSYNYLKSLPGGLFSNMESLKILDLEHNWIEFLNKSTFDGLSNLQNLSLTENRIDYLDKETFAPIKYLKVLSLSKNNLTISTEKNVQLISAASLIFYWSPLEYMRGLSSLDLSHNNISIYCEDWAGTLNTINLSHNYITSVPVIKILNFYKDDTTVDLRYNNIQQSEPFKIYYSAKVTFLMDYNPYRCDCNLYDFIHNYKLGTKNPKIGIDQAECAQPPALKGVKLVDLQPEELNCDVDCKTGDIIEHSSNASNCKCVLNKYRRRIEMFCDNLPDVYPELPRGINSTYLKLKCVTDIPLLPAEVEIVDLSFLNITNPPKANSVTLNLTNNFLKRAPFELFERNCSVYLSNNPFDCTCSRKDDLLALNAFQNLIPDYNNLTCSNGDFVSKIVVEQLCAVRNGTIIGLSLGIIGILFITCTIIAFKYRTELRIILRRLRLWRGDVLGGEVYDAFVSFAHQDEEFVREKLLPKLEKGKPPLKICIHYRDWVIGDYIPAQISRSVEQSRYTIIVLTRHFVESMWGRMEFRTAHAKDRVIILMLEDLSADKSLDPELRAYISMNTHVKADDSLVWERLRDAVLHRRKRNSKPNQLTTTVPDCE